MYNGEQNGFLKKHTTLSIFLAKKDLEVSLKLPSEHMSNNQAHDAESVSTSRTQKQICSCAKGESSHSLKIEAWLNIHCEVKVRETPDLSASKQIGLLGTHSPCIGLEGSGFDCLLLLTDDTDEHF
ncbi:hypothetical protein KIL84_019845 [Mauremys mutica]|uniref:Uncharacterized protein n=1 Tax=Mauremys mutica TaxID=74926 RepID=A0A9D4BAN3_9SAUR|nr:hypothetical protein KIL84_019845 [Mauremys mutica]